MPKYNDVSYGHFVTTKTFMNRRLFNDPAFCELLLEDINFYRKKYDFKVIAYVIIPDHLHIILFWDAERYPKMTISKIVQDIKSHFAKEAVSYMKTGRRKPSLSPYSNAQSEGSELPGNYIWQNTGKVHTPARNQIWQPSFYDFNIYSDKKLEQKVNYIHWNPVQAGLCANPEDWSWSSYRSYEFGEQGLLNIDSVEW